MWKWSLWHFWHCLRIYSGVFGNWIYLWSRQGRVHRLRWRHCCSAELPSVSSFSLSLTLMRAASHLPVMWMYLMFLFLLPIVTSKLWRVQRRINITFRDSLVLYNDNEYNAYRLHASGSLFFDRWGCIFLRKCRCSRCAYKLTTKDEATSTT